MISLVTLLFLVAGTRSAAQYAYTTRHQHTVIDMKLNQMLRHIDSVSTELKKMDKAYKALQQDKSSDPGVTEALLSARGHDNRELWQDNHRLCKPAEKRLEFETFGEGNWLDTKKFDCGQDQNYFLMQVEYSDERGVINAHCCKRKKGGRD